MKTKEKRNSWEKELRKTLELAGSIDDCDDIECGIRYVRSLLASQKQELIKRIKRIIGKNEPSLIYRDCLGQYWDKGRNPTAEFLVTPREAAQDPTAIRNAFRKDILDLLEEEK